MRAVELEIPDLRVVVEGDAVGAGNQAQRGIDVREMVGGDVTEKGAMDFVVAHAAVQPAEKQCKLREKNGSSRKQRECGRRHGFWMLEVGD